MGEGRAEPQKDQGFDRKGAEGVTMSLVKRFAVAFSSLLALVLAGGAHWKL